MSCGRNGVCLNIANRYARREDEINSNLDKMSNSITEISESLSNLSIPNDYVGQKIEEKIKKINSNMTNDISSISSFKSGMKSFINERITEHRKHYYAWKKKEKAGDNNAK